MGCLGLLAFILLGFLWKLGPRRFSQPGFKFVYVNQDGSVRELSPGEREYLSQEFVGGDGGRPYIKSSYESRDGYGSRSGYLRRRQVPIPIEIWPVHPDFDTREKERGYDPLGANHAAGDLLETSAEGKLTRIAPNPSLSRRKRWKLIRAWELADQRRRESLAVFHAQDEAPLESSKGQRRRASTVC